MNESTLWSTIQEALRLRDVMRFDGQSESECAAALERQVRHVWPFTREWKYLCQSCDDRGAVWHDCPGDATCGRTREHRPHDYIVPCWCDQGRRFKPKAKTEQDFTAAGKTSKPMARWGR